MDYEPIIRGDAPTDNFALARRQRAAVAEFMLNASFLDMGLKSVAPQPS
jgi:hypothetical protein